MGVVLVVGLLFGFRKAEEELDRMGGPGANVFVHRKTAPTPALDAQPADASATARLTDDPDEPLIFGPPPSETARQTCEVPSADLWAVSAGVNWPGRADLLHHLAGGCLRCNRVLAVIRHSLAAEREAIARADGQFASFVSDGWLIQKDSSGAIVIRQSPRVTPIFLTGEVTPKGIDFRLAVHDGDAAHPGATVHCLIVYAEGRTRTDATGTRCVFGSVKRGEISCELGHHVDGHLPLPDLSAPDSFAVVMAVRKL